MDGRLFRCYSIRDKIFIFEDISLFVNDFPDLLNHRIINGGENFIMTESTGCYDREGTSIYENDIISYNKGIYQVVFNPPGFVLEHRSGNFSEEIDPTECIVIGYDPTPNDLFN